MLETIYYHLYFRHSCWSDVKKKLHSDPRYKNVDSSGLREDYFLEFIHDLKDEHKKKKKDKKRSSRSRSRSPKGKDRSRSRSRRHSKSPKNNELSPAAAEKVKAKSIPPGFPSNSNTGAMPDFKSGNSNSKKNKAPLDSDGEEAPVTKKKKVELVFEDEMKANEGSNNTSNGGANNNAKSVKSKCF